MTTVHVVVPDGVDDAARPSGGNVYDRRVCDELTARGWDVVESPFSGRWPDGDPDSRSRLGAYLAGLPDGELVLVDGLIGSAVPELLAPEGDRLRLVLLMHMPLATQAEQRSLRAVRSVLATSGWTRAWLANGYDGPVAVALPGTDPAPVARAEPAGRRWLVVGPVARHKGVDVLVGALAGLADLDWCLVWVGALDVDPEAVASARRELDRTGLQARVRLAGPRPASGMGSAYAAADLLVLPSRAETYGMVVAEALAAGVPVVAGDVGGVAEALGVTAAGRPGRLVPAGDPVALAGALRDWLTDASLRERWRAAARERRHTLPTWSAAADQVERALQEAAA